VSTAIKSGAETALRSPEFSHKTDRSLTFSLYDGFFYSLTVGFAETYFSAFAVFLGANNLQLALLAVLPPFCGGVSQFFTLRILNHMKSRQQMVCRFALAQGLFFVPMLLSYYVYGIRAEIFLLAVIGYFICGQVVGPVWNSWIGDLAPISERGSFFGLRNRVITVGAFLSMVTGSFILRIFENTRDEIFGFMAIFSLAMLARSVSVKFLSLKSDKDHADSKSDYSKFFDFIKTIRNRNEGRLILYTASVNFAVFLSAPFFTPYLLKTQKYSYATFIAVTSAVALAKVLSSPFWGSVVDSMGTRKVLKITGAMLPFSILPWGFTGDPYLLIVSQLFSGFMWAGYEISTFTFLLDAVRPSDRAKVASYSNFISFSAALVGGIIGTLIVSLGPQPLHEYALVFIVSSVLRLVAYFAFVPSIDEVRIISPVKTADVLIKAIGFRHVWGFTNRIVVFRRRR